MRKAKRIFIYTGQDKIVSISEIEAEPKSEVLK